MGNFITVLTVTFVVYFMLALAVFDSESIGDRKLIPEGNLQVKRTCHVPLVLNVLCGVSDNRWLSRQKSSLIIAGAHGPGVLA